MNITDLKYKYDWLPILSNIHQRINCYICHKTASRFSSNKSLCIDGGPMANMGKCDFLCVDCIYKLEQEDVSFALGLGASN